MLESIKRDLWVVLLDIVAVNLSYYLALLIRFYVNFQLRPVAVDRYLPAWEGFTPWYTILSIVIFAAWRLYGGLWRYAGINDMNRIIFATLCTTVVQVVGTSIFFTRMPITYYVIGAVLQFVFVVCIRFGYRVLLVEKRRLRRGEKIKALVVGSGENGRRVVKHLEEEGTFRPMAIVGSGSGTMDGIPIIALSQVNWDDVKTIFIADPLITTEERAKIREHCEDVQDYTGFFSNMGGRLSLTELLSVIRGPVVVEIDGHERRFEDGAEALQSLTDKYSVVEVSGDKLTLKLEKGRNISTQEALEAAYASVMGE